MQMERLVSRSGGIDTALARHGRDLPNPGQTPRLSWHRQGTGRLGEAAVIAHNVEAASRRGLRTADDTQKAAQRVIRRSALASDSINTQSDVNTFALTAASSQHQRRELNSPFIRPRDMLVLESLMPQRLGERAVQYPPLNHRTGPLSPARGLPAPPLFRAPPQAGRTLAAPASGAGPALLPVREEMVSRFPLLARSAEARASQRALLLPAALVGPPLPALVAPQGAPVRCPCGRGWCPASRSWRAVRRRACRSVRCRCLSRDLAVTSRGASWGLARCRSCSRCWQRQRQLDSRDSLRSRGALGQARCRCPGRADAGPRSGWGARWSRWGGGTDRPRMRQHSAGLGGPPPAGYPPRPSPVRPPRRGARLRPRRLVLGRPCCPCGRRWCPASRSWRAVRRRACRSVRCRCLSRDLAVTSQGGVVGPGALPLLQPLLAAPAPAGFPGLSPVARRVGAGALPLPRARGRGTAEWLGGTLESVGRWDGPATDAAALGGPGEAPARGLPAPPLFRAPPPGGAHACGPGVWCWAGPVARAGGDGVPLPAPGAQCGGRASQRALLLPAALVGPPSQRWWPRRGPVRCPCGRGCVPLPAPGAQCGGARVAACVVAACPGTSQSLPGGRRGAWRAAALAAAAGSASASWIPGALPGRAARWGRRAAVAPGARTRDRGVAGGHAGVGGAVGRTGHGCGSTRRAWGAPARGLPAPPLFRAPPQAGRTLAAPASGAGPALLPVREGMVSRFRLLARSADGARDAARVVAACGARRPSPSQRWWPRRGPVRCPCGRMVPASRSWRAVRRRACRSVRCRCLSGTSQPPPGGRRGAWRATALAAAAGSASPGFSGLPSVARRVGAGALPLLRARGRGTAEWLAGALESAGRWQAPMGRSDTGLPHAGYGSEAATRQGWVLPIAAPTFQEGFTLHRPLSPPHTALRRFPSRASVGAGDEAGDARAPMRITSLVQPHDDRETRFPQPDNPTLTDTGRLATTRRLVPIGEGAARTLASTISLPTLALRTVQRHVITRSRTGDKGGPASSIEELLSSLPGVIEGGFGASEGHSAIGIGRRGSLLNLARARVDSFDEESSAVQRSAGSLAAPLAIATWGVTPATVAEYRRTTSSPLGTMQPKEAVRPDWSQAVAATPAVTRPQAWSSTPASPLLLRSFQPRTDR